MCLSASAIPTGRVCWSSWRATCAAGRCRIGGCARVMGSRSSSGMKSEPKGPGARRGSGRWAYPWSSSLGAGGCMCLRPGPCECGVGGCMPIPQATRWPRAGSNEVKGRSRPSRRSTGCARARPGVRRLQSAVRSVGSVWCAPRSSRGPAPPRPPRRDGSRWHEGAHSRGRPEADHQGSTLAFKGANGAVCAPDRSTSSQTCGDGQADRPPEMRREPLEGPTPGWEQGPISIANAPATSRSVRGPSNPALKRTATSSGVPPSIGLAAA